MNKRERILGPAIRHNGKVYSLPAPNRHHHVLHKHAVRRNGIIVSSIAGGEQGFYTDQREFVNRFHAKVIARISEQNLRDTGQEDTLYTEDMW